MITLVLTSPRFHVAKFTGHVLLHRKRNWHIARSPAQVPIACRRVLSSAESPEQHRAGSQVYRLPHPERQLLLEAKVSGYLDNCKRRSKLLVTAWREFCFQNGHPCVCLEPQRYGAKAYEVLLWQPTVPFQGRKSINAECISAAAKIILGTQNCKKVSGLASHGNLFGEGNEHHHIITESSILITCKCADVRCRYSQGVCALYMHVANVSALRQYQAS